MLIINDVVICLTYCNLLNPGFSWMYHQEVKMTEIRGGILAGKKI